MPQVVPLAGVRARSGWARVAKCLEDQRNEPAAEASADAGVDFPDLDPLSRPQPARRADADVQAGEGEAVEGNETDARDGDVSWAEYNRQLRTRLVAWARSNPGNVLLVLRAAMIAA